MCRPSEWRAGLLGRSSRRATAMPEKRYLFSPYCPLWIQAMIRHLNNMMRTEPISRRCISPGRDCVAVTPKSLLITALRSKKTKDMETSNVCSKI